MHFCEIPYGFEYGAAKVSRLISDEKKGWVVIGIETPKHVVNGGLQVYVTKTGKIRIFSSEGEYILQSFKRSKHI